MLQQENLERIMVIPLDSNVFDKLDEISGSIVGLLYKDYKNDDPNINKERVIYELDMLNIYLSRIELDKLLKESLTFTSNLFYIMGILDHLVASCGIKKNIDIFSNKVDLINNIYDEITLPMKKNNMDPKKDIPLILKKDNIFSTSFDMSKDIKIVNEIVFVRNFNHLPEVLKLIVMRDVNIYSEYTLLIKRTLKFYLDVVEASNKLIGVNNQTKNISKNLFNFYLKN